MDSHKLLNSLGHIEDKFIEEAEHFMRSHERVGNMNIVRTPKKAWKRWSTAAACFCILAAGVIGIMHLSMNGGILPSGPGLPPAVGSTDDSRSTDNPSIEKGNALTTIQERKEYGPVLLSSRSANEVLSLVHSNSEEIDWDYILEGKTETLADDPSDTPDILTLPNVYADEQYLYWFNDDGSLFARVALNEPTGAEVEMTETEVVSTAANAISKYKPGFSTEDYTMKITQDMDDRRAWRLLFTKSTADILTALIDVEIDKFGQVSNILISESPVDLTQTNTYITDSTAIESAIAALRESKYMVDLSSQDYEINISRSAISGIVTYTVEFGVPAVWNPDVTQLYIVTLDAVSGETLMVTASR